MKGKIVAVMKQTREETKDPDGSMNLFAEKMAEAIIEEIKELKIIYTTGLVAPPSGGPVTGTIEATIE